jgi:hypothetical protein
VGTVVQPVVGLQLSVVQTSPSLQTMGVWLTPVAGSQASVVHASPSSMLTGTWAQAPFSQPSVVQASASSHIAGSQATPPLPPLPPAPPFPPVPVVVLLPPSPPLPPVPVVVVVPLPPAPPFPPLPVVVVVVLLPPSPPLPVVVVPVLPPLPPLPELLVVVVFDELPGAARVATGHGERARDEEKARRDRRVFGDRLEEKQCHDVPPDCVSEEKTTRRAEPGQTLPPFAALRHFRVGHRAKESAISHFARAAEGPLGVDVLAIVTRTAHRHRDSRARSPVSPGRACFAALAAGFALLLRATRARARSRAAQGHRERRERAERGRSGRARSQGRALRASLRHGGDRQRPSLQQPLPPRHAARLRPRVPLAHRDLSGSRRGLHARRAGWRAARRGDAPDLFARGISQQVLTPSYLLAFRPSSRFFGYGRLGPSIILSPDPTIGGELAAGAALFFTSRVALAGELCFDLYYGAGTPERGVIAYPILSGQLGLLVDYEVLP